MSSFKWILPLVLFTGCATNNPDDLKDAWLYGKGTAVSLFASLNNSIAPLPDDEIKPGPCLPEDQGGCGGDGKVGDGRIAVDCGMCGGDGRIDEEDLRRDSETGGDSDTAVPPTVDGPPGPLIWHTSIREAIESVSELGKPVFVYFCSDTCPKCVIIERDVLTDTLVKDQLSQYSLARVKWIPEERELDRLEWDIFTRDDKGRSRAQRVFPYCAVYDPKTRRVQPWEMESDVTEFLQSLAVAGRDIM